MAATPAPQVNRPTGGAAGLVHPLFHELFLTQPPHGDRRPRRTRPRKASVRTVRTGAAHSTRS